MQQSPQNNAGCMTRVACSAIDGWRMLFQVIGRPMNKQGYGIAVSPLFPELARVLSVELMNMQQNGRLVDINSYWLPAVVCICSAQPNGALRFLIPVLEDWPFSQWQTSVTLPRSLRRTTRRSHS
jgi:hypothetical protein